MKENKQITIQIKSIFEKVLFEYTKENNNIKETLEEAINNNADLSNANLRYANLSNADLSNADLYNANLNDEEKIRKGIIINKPIRVFKKCENNNIVELKLLKGSIVFSINNKKCRTNKVKVISINGGKKKGLQCKSNYDKGFIYEVGKIVEVKDFDLMYNVECSSGIHFFWTKEEAEDYDN